MFPCQASAETLSTVSRSRNVEFQPRSYTQKMPSQARDRQRNVRRARPVGNESAIIASINNSCELMPERNADRLQEMTRRPEIRG
jgi:hypothetical protein